MSAMAWPPLSTSSSSSPSSENMAITASFLIRLSAASSSLFLSILFFAAFHPKWYQRAVKPCPFAAASIEQLRLLCQPILQCLKGRPWIHLNHIADVAVAVEPIQLCRCPCAETLTHASWRRPFLFNEYVHSQRCPALPRSRSSSYNPPPPGPGSTAWISLRRRGDPSACLLITL